MPVEEFQLLLPAELKTAIRSKDRHQQSNGFATRLWGLLQWAGSDDFRQKNLGCGWISESEFFLDKGRFSKVVGIPTNTLNFKLRSCRFAQSRQRQDLNTYWKCDSFRKASSVQDLQDIDMRRTGSDNFPSVTSQALYLPLLDSIKLYASLPSEVPRFKAEAIFVWEDIMKGRSPIWAVNARDFFGLAAEKFCSSMAHTNGGDAFSFDAQQTEFTQYLKANNLTLIETAKSMLFYVMNLADPRVVTIKDFHRFFARFAPEECILDKIHQLLCCSHASDDWFYPKEQQFRDGAKICGCYSNTFANCFVIRRFGGPSYHVYNLPSANARTSFLVDETGKKLLTWHAVFESFVNQGVQIATGYGDDF
jgi:hypothetical protein